MTPRDQPTIDEALGQFLAEQRERLSERTFRNYDYVVEALARRARVRRRGVG